MIFTRSTVVRVPELTNAVIAGLVASCAPAAVMPLSVSPLVGQLLMHFHRCTCEEVEWWSDEGQSLSFLKIFVMYQNLKKYIYIYMIRYICIYISYICDSSRVPGQSEHGKTRSTTVHPHTPSLRWTDKRPKDSLLQFLHLVLRPIGVGHFRLSIMT